MNGIQQHLSQSTPSRAFALRDTGRGALQCCGDIHPNPGPTGQQRSRPTCRFLTLATQNVTSLTSQLGTATSIDAEVIALQETALTAVGQKLCADQLADKAKGGWTPHWGPGQEGDKDKGGVPSAYFARGKGVAFFTRNGIPASLVPPKSRLEHQLHNDGRFLHLEIAYGNGKSTLHILTVYGHASPGAKHLREQLISDTFKVAAGLGPVPLVVMGDFNANSTSSPALARAESLGYVDAAMEQAARDATTEDITSNTAQGGATEKHTLCSAPMTYFSNDKHKGTRIDLVYLNPIAAGAFVRAETLTAGCPKHMYVAVTLNLPAFEQDCLQYQLPKPIPLPPGFKCNKEKDLALASSIVASLDKQSFQDKDVEAAWNITSMAMEEFLIRQAGIPLQSVGSAYVGRGQVREPRLVRLSAQDGGNGIGAATEISRQFTNLITKLRELIRFASTHTAGAHVPTCTTQCWDRIRTLSLSLQKHLTTPFHWSRSFPTLEQLTNLLAIATDSEELYLDKVRDYRIQGWTHKMQAALGTDLRSVTKWLKAPETSKSNMLEREDGSTTANLREQDQILRDAWKDTFQMYETRQEPEWEPFRKRFGQYIAKHKMDNLPLITGKALARVIKKKKDRSASGIDGWRIAELKRIPLPLLDLFAELLNLVEELGVWPKALMTALVTMLPKGEGRQPLKQRPITVTSTIYRLWASVRLNDVIVWQEKWIKSNQNGFRPRKSTSHVTLRIALEIEESLLGDSSKPLRGIALDYMKCFDRVPQGLTLRLLSELGLADSILRPIIGAYTSMERRFKLPLGVGETFKTTNGILQGCPLSVIMINALLSIWTAAIEDKVPDAFTVSYADDAYILSRISEEALQKGLDLTETFCALTGMALNLKKTFAFGTHAYISTVSLNGHVFETVKEIKCLGCWLHTSRDLRRAGLKLEEATPILHRLSGMPLPFATKAAIIGDSIMPSALYGALYTRSDPDAIGSLVSDTVKCLWGHRARGRSTEIVLGVLSKVHRLHPALMLPYLRMTEFVRMIRLEPMFLTKVNRIRSAYSTTPQAASDYDGECGPVGLILGDFDLLGFSWVDNFCSLTFKETTTNPLTMKGSAWNHLLRDCLKSRLHAAIIRKRTSYTGIDQGVLLDETNDLWMRPSTTAVTSTKVRLLIAGAVLPRARQYSNAKRKDPTTALTHCTLCPMHVDETLRHILWECPAYASLRSKSEYASARSCETSQDCIALHGIIPLSINGHPTSDVWIGNIQCFQLLAAAILDHRDTLLADETKARRLAYPWLDLEKLPCTAVKSPLASRDWLSSKIWQHGEMWFNILNRWASELRWAPSNTIHVATAELAIDVELWSGLDLPTHQKPAPLSQRARLLQRMIRNLNGIASSKGLRRPFPASPTFTSDALRWSGVNRVLGQNRRPLFACGKTIDVIQHSFPDAVTNYRSTVQWGSNLYPVYDSAYRLRRSLIWYPNRIKECPLHNLAKCYNCPNVLDCCETHHLCSKHKALPCTTCGVLIKRVSGEDCCISGHHKLYDTHHD